MFAAMHPSGAAAHPCAHAVVSLLLTSDVAPVHGGSFHSTPSSSTAASATAARLVAAVERVLGNTVISQYQAAQSSLTVLEELQAMRRAA